jgi:putative pyruvate formate lyase activating enzyme
MYPVPGQHRPSGKVKKKTMPTFRPGYIRLYETGELFERIKVLKEMLSNCTVCPRNCTVDRTRGELGVCNVGSLPVVSSAAPHFGEEPPLVGRFGSGTIFLTLCNLKCVFCQNYDISQLGHGDEVSTEELSSMMVGLARRGCHNINFVTPTHQVPQIVEALPGAIEDGLEVPLVYNCGGYESVDTIKLLDGIFDIYMPDIKYGENDNAKKYSKAPGYVEIVKAAVREMHRQVGDLACDADGIAEKGLIIRHLVLPEGLAGTGTIMRFIAGEISKDSYVNVMDQYRPCHRAGEFPELSRGITTGEFEEAVEAAQRAGLTRLAGVTA